MCPLQLMLPELGIELDALLIEVEEPIAVEVFRVDLVLVLKNIFRNAVLAVGGIELAIIMVLASVVGAFYYLRVIWYMYFEEPEDKAVLQASTRTRLVLSLNALAVLALGIVPGWLLALCIQVLNP